MGKSRGAKIQGQRSFLPYTTSLSQAIIPLSHTPKPVSKLFLVWGEIWTRMHGCPSSSSSFGGTDRGNYLFMLPLLYVPCGVVTTMHGTTDHRINFWRWAFRFFLGRENWFSVNFSSPSAVETDLVQVDILKFLSTFFRKKSTK